jgi:hypothetical protein
MKRPPCRTSVHIIVKRKEKENIFGSTPEIVENTKG